MVAFGGAAPAYTFAQIERLRIQCEAANTGTIRAAISPGFTEEVRRTTAQWERRGAPVAFLDGGQMSTAVGSARYRGGFLDRRGGSLNPLGYARGLAEAVQKAGGRVHGSTPALRVRRDGVSWKIETPSGVIRADKLVIATNGYTGPLWPALRQSIIPVYSGIAASEPLPAELASVIMPGRPVLYENSWFFAYYRVDIQGRLLMGGRSRLADTSNPAHFQHLILHARKLFPSLAALRWTRFWNGQVAITADRYPHIHEPATGVHIGLGYNGRGVAMATAVGGLLAKRILGAAPSEIALPVTGIKPFACHGLWKLAASFRLVYGRLRAALEA